MDDDTLITQKALKDMDTIWGLKTPWMNKKDRNLIVVHRRLQQLYLKKEALIKVSGAWFKSTPKHQFLGITKDNMGKDQRVIYYMGEERNSFSKEYPDNGYDHNKKHYLRALRNEELPLHVNHPDYQSIQAQRILQSRLKGEYLEIPYHQDLVEQRDKLDHQFNRIWKVIGCYEKILEDYVEEHKKKDYFNTTTLLIYTIEGHDYYFKSQGERTLIAPSHVERIE
jgi:hypothetical protein